MEIQKTAGDCQREEVVQKEERLAALSKEQLIVFIDIYSKNWLAINNI